MPNRAPVKSLARCCSTADHAREGRAVNRAIDPRDSGPGGWLRQHPIQAVLWAFVAVVLLAVWLSPDARQLVMATAERVRPYRVRHEIRTLIIRWGPWAPLASILIAVARTFVPIPGEFIAAADGAAFGFWEGSVLLWIGTMASACLAFGIARALGRPVVERFVPERALARFDALVGEAGWDVAVLVRFLPIPGDVINFGLGLTRLSWSTYLWTTGVAIVPWVVAWAAVGAGALSAHRTLPWALGGLALITVAGLVIRRRLRIAHRHPVG
jgi:uncharacterized membrane protein YdjX (TVP38/TMEM64 family)